MLSALCAMGLNADIWVSIAAAGGIGPLVEFLRSGNSIAKENVAGLLKNLSDRENNRMTIVAAGGVHPLVDLAKSGTRVAKEY
eukprot:6204997-Pleurochrysis_carterae.AAC.1